MDAGSSSGIPVGRSMRNMSAVTFLFQLLSSQAGLRPPVCIVCLLLASSSCNWEGAAMADHSVTMENTLSTLLADKKYSTIRDVLVTMNPADIAAVFSGVETEKLPLLFRLLPKELAAESFVEMESDQQELLIRGLSDSELRQVMDEL